MLNTYRWKIGYNSIRVYFVHVSQNNYQMIQKTGNILLLFFKM